jgi:hypothetical protein
MGNGTRTGGFLAGFGEVRMWGYSVILNVQAPHRAFAFFLWMFLLSSNEKPARRRRSARHRVPQQIDLFAENAPTIGGMPAWFERHAASFFWPLPSARLWPNLRTWRFTFLTVSAAASPIRLANIEDRFALQMMGADLVRDHDRPSSNPSGACRHGPGSASSSGSLAPPASPWVVRRSDRQCPPNGRPLPAPSFRLSQDG